MTISLDADLLIEAVGRTDSGRVVNVGRLGHFFLIEDHLHLAAIYSGDGIVMECGRGERSTERMCVGRLGRHILPLYFKFCENCVTIFAGPPGPEDRTL